MDLFNPELRIPIMTSDSIDVFPNNTAINFGPNPLILAKIIDPPIHNANGPIM